MNQEMQTMTEIEDMKQIAKTLTSWLKEESSCGKENFDTNSCGAVSDIIKDMKEAIKECLEAEYYKTVIEAMQEGREPAYGEGSYGYNHRHMANGEFASHGKGHYVRGYSHDHMPYLDQHPYIDGYLNDPNFRNKMMGYSDGQHGTSRHGELYDNYHTAKRYYHDSKSLKDKEAMEKHSMAYMDNTLKNMRAMWQEADPSLKMKMKKDFGEEIGAFLEGGM